ncbi:2OG-Fe(II) oxygenase [Pseudomonas turukhanskensis]|uniref:2OG-Fe(II) oxygenase n=1 Tax=Pseudomonas turukhanskensis TaxID=1806536 RepID=A0A9W6K257_9PSED|nr:2OG-Fe(II) oxygenase [Pseudomonas turukhanskensis]GLK87392.1 2OG-Fe(II) oxygenase [Pseudomonas turukhanskensis]
MPNTSATLLLDHTVLTTIVDDLATRGWSQHDLFIAQGLTRDLAAECQQRAADGRLAPAAVGRGASAQVREGVRGDSIQWLEAGESAATDAYLAMMDQLRQGLNQALYLGLDDYESHFALYPPGAFYQRHVDRFRDDDRRTVSAVLYLNEGWLPEQGGALRIYPEDKAHDVAPVGGRLVIFMSGELPHEVLPATRERLSLTGWFRRRQA